VFSDVPAGMTSSPSIGMGCMRLSTERDRDEANAIAVLHAAVDAGVTFLDTADAYCWDDTERGHNERLIARALATWSGERSRVQVATKGGLTRPVARDTLLRRATRAAERSASSASLCISCTHRIRERRCRPASARLRR
jgi:aryl-alcohol dehydrogenase-like predicted oxidoreductase